MQESPSPPRTLVAPPSHLRSCLDPAEAAASGMQEQSRTAVIPDGSQCRSPAAAAMESAEAGRNEPSMPDNTSEHPCSGSIKYKEDDAISIRGKGVPLSTVVAAYDRESERKTAQEEGKDVKAGSRGSSQTRTEVCGNDVHG